MSYSYVFYSVPYSKAFWCFLCRSPARNGRVCWLYTAAFVWRGHFFINTNGKILCSQDRKALLILLSECFILLQQYSKKKNAVSAVKLSLDDDCQLNLYFGTSVFWTCISLPKPADFTEFFSTFLRIPEAEVS